MTSTDIEARNSSLVPRVGMSGRAGQATQIEMSRAVAEVQAAIVVAQNCPRDVETAIAAMRQSCSQRFLAEQAFFRFPRGNQTVSGPSVHLARELARCYGNLQYGLVELSRDDDAGQSEMLAFAWDVQTNTRNSSTFIQPHIRDTRDGPNRVTDIRDIYELNANAGARRVREAIFAILPAWFVEEAKELCDKTLMDGGGKPLEIRRADAIKAYGVLGVTQSQIEAKIGRSADQWIEQDLAQLQVIYRSLQRGEVSKDQEFPDDRVTAADILSAPKQAQAPTSEAAAAVASQESSDAPPAPAAEPATPATSAAAAPSPTKATLGKLLARFPFPNEDDVESLLRWKAGGKGTLKELTQDDVEFLTGYLQLALDNAQGDPAAASAEIWRQYGADHPAAGQ